MNLAFINDTLDFEGDPRAFSTFFGTADVPANQDAENGNDVTYINDEAASIGGTITQIEVYINSTSGTYDIGVFSKDGNDFTDVDSIATGITVVTGYNKFTAPADFSAMTINAGEYVGTFGQDTERSTTGASGFWFDNGGQIGNNSASTFTDAGGTVDIQLRVVIEIADGDPWDVGADEVVAAAAAAPSGRRRRVIMGSIDNKWKQDYTLEIPLWTTRNTFGLPY